MCGILGSSFSSLDFTCLQHRGEDNTSIVHANGFTFSHSLHSIVGDVIQPLGTERYVFGANCEIYNWKELGEGENDAETLFYSLIHKGVSVLDDVDGVYAFFLYDKETKELVVARDALGVKPLWYAHSEKGFAFASERKALQYLDGVRELHPRHILHYDEDSNTVETSCKEFIQNEEATMPYEEAVDSTATLLEQAVLKRVPQQHRVGLLFSGGIDSAIIAHILKENSIPFTAYYGGVKGRNSIPKDEERAKKIASLLDIHLQTNIVSRETVSKALPDIIHAIDDNNFVKVSVAIPLYFAAQNADEKVMLTGGEAECIFGGHQRHSDTFDLNKDCLSELRRVWYRDLYRDDTIMMRHGSELRVPFLDSALVKHCMRIPGELKTRNGKKGLLRDIARRLGMPEEAVNQPKLSAQYGSHAVRTLKSIAEGQINEWLADTYPSHNIRLLSFLSTGKDSCLATQRMIDYNYDVVCFGTVHSENPDSYMSHTPKTEYAKTIARKARIPLIERRSRGEKEKELEDYKAIMEEAVSTYGVEGVVTGAIRSEYQKQRIEKLAEEVGLKTYAPLWRIDEEQELYELLRRGFDVEIVKVAAYGLDESWVGRRLDESVIEDLRELHEEVGLSFAGEGGEYETLVHDAPFMRNTYE